MTTIDEQLELIERNLTNHPPVSEHVVSDFEAVRDAAKELGAVIIHFSPQSREQSLALTNLEQTVMWTIAAIARNQELS